MPNLKEMAPPGQAWTQALQAKQSGDGAVLLENCLHDVGRADRGAGRAGLAGVVIDGDLVDPHLLGRPADQPEGAEQVAPGPIDEQRHKHCTRKKRHCLKKSV